MKTKDMLMSEFDLECAYSRKALERVPDDQMGWKPHHNSMTLGELASFLAVIPSWGLESLTRDGYDALASDRPVPERTGTRDELLALFDRNVIAARAAIAAANDETLDLMWTLRAGDQVFFTQPRWLVYRTYFMNHAIHHRGQLTVYLRMLDVPVPAIYNDSADERGGMFLDPPAAAA